MASGNRKSAVASPPTFGNPPKHEANLEHLRTMGLVAVGDIAEMEEQAESGAVSVDDFGLDTCTRIWMGIPEAVQTLLAKYPKKSQDPIYTMLRRQSCDITPGRSFVTVNMRFIGIFNDDLPDVKIEGGWRRQTASITQQALVNRSFTSVDQQAVDIAAAMGELVDTRVDSGAEAQLTYYAPVSTYRYVTRKKPTKRRFAGRIEQTAENWDMPEIRGLGDGRLNEVRPMTFQSGINVGGTIKAGFFNYVRAIGTSIFTFTEAGDYWEVIEQNEGRIQQVSAADLPSVLSSEELAPDEPVIDPQEET